MTHYLKTGEALYPSGHSEVLDGLPLGTYGVAYDANRAAFYLERMPDLSIGSGKVYGPVSDRIGRVFRSFEDRESSTGVLLVGEKGSGKTMTAKMASIEGARRGMPTILISQPHVGDEFNTLLKSLDQPSVIVFDEFEKVYEDRKKQAALLSVFDGVLTRKHLIVVTLNESRGLLDYFFNRPGRFFYRFDFFGLEEEFVREYCLDRLTDKEQVDGVVTLAKSFIAFNFDLLAAIVEEMNRFGMSAREAVNGMNVSFAEEKLTWRVASYVVKGPDSGWKGSYLHSGFHRPLIDQANLNVYTGDDSQDRCFTLSPTDIVSYSKGRVRYETDEVVLEIESERKVRLDPLSVLA